jgi:hypothetical protein
LVNGQEVINPLSREDAEQVCGTMEGPDEAEVEVEDG